MKYITCAYGVITFPEWEVYYHSDDNPETLFPLVADVRNAESHGIEKNAIIMIAKDPSELSQAEYDNIRAWVYLHIHPEDELYEKEIHCIKPGLPGKYEDNYLAERTMNEYWTAPELGLFSFPIYTPRSENSYYGCGIVLPNMANRKMQMLEASRNFLS